MKKIAVITGGLLPMPSVKGGAIETLLQYLIDYNEINEEFQLEIYSIYNEKAETISKKYRNSKFSYININKFVKTIYFNTCRILRKIGCKDPDFQKLYINKVCKEIKNKQYDLILIESDNHFVLPIKQITNTPIILYLHNDKLNSSTKNARIIADNCLSILTVSEYIKDRVLTIDDSYNEKTDFILNGIETEKFSIENKEQIRDQLRKKYKLNEDDFVFLFTGRIEPNKGVLELVKAFNKINNEKAKIIILGGSFFSSNRKTKYVKKIEEEIGNNKNIIVTGYINYNDIPKYHAMSDCMVSPSMWEEPGSLVNLEAFASGLPLISSYSGGTPQYTKNTDSILIKKDEKFIDNLSEAMEHIIEDKQLREKMIKSQLENSKYFSKERYCEEISQYLEGKC